MRSGRAPTGDVDRILKRLQRRSHLSRMMVSLSREVERLHEDNVQLRAAVRMYQEALNRRAAKSPKTVKHRDAGPASKAGHAAASQGHPA